MKLISYEKFWDKIKSSPNIVVGINDYEDLTRIFPEKYHPFQRIKVIHLTDHSGWLKLHKINPILDLILWIDEAKIKEKSLFFDISPVVQIYFPRPSQLALSNFPSYLGEVCCMQSSFDEESLKQAWQLVQDGFMEWIILDSTDNNHNDHYILIEKEEHFLINHDLQAILNTF